MGLTLKVCGEDGDDSCLIRLSSRILSSLILIDPCVGFRVSSAGVGTSLPTPKAGLGSLGKHLDNGVCGLCSEFVPEVSTKSPAWAPGGPAATGRGWMSRAPALRALAAGRAAPRGTPGGPPEALGSGPTTGGVRLLQTPMLPRSPGH